MLGKMLQFRNLDVVVEVLAEAKKLLNEQREIIEKQQEEIDNLKRDLQSKIDDLQQQIDQIQKPVDKVDFPLFGERLYPMPDVYPRPSGSPICPKCGMSWEGTMGYSCPDPQCPIQPYTSAVTDYTSYADYTSTQARRDNMSSPGNKDYED